MNRILVETNHRSESQPQKLRSEYQPQKLRSESHTLRNESHTLRNESQKLRSESHTLRNESQKLENELLIHRNKVQVLRSKLLTRRIYLQILRDELCILRSKLQKTNEPEKADAPEKTDEPKKTDEPEKTNEPEKTDEPKKTFINNESPHKKMIGIIKTILEESVCEKFTNEKFRTLRVSKDMILLYSEYTSIKVCKKKCKIDIGRDIISLHAKTTYVNNAKEDNAICIDDEQIIIESYQTRYYQGIHIETKYQYIYLMTKSSVLHQ